MAINDDYLSCKAYEGHDADPKNEGFTLFQDKKSGKYHFAYLGTSDTVLLRSEGYVDVSSRTKGIAAVKKNVGSSDRIAISEEAGKYFVVLKAGNNKEIGRSCDFKTKAAAEKVLEKFGLAAKEEKPVRKSASSKKSVEKVVSTANLDQLLQGLSNYLEVHEYLDRDRIWDSYGITGYVKFEQAGKHYFGVYNPDATLYLRSEGFATEEDRDSAFDLMDSTILLEENYKIENLNGRYYAILFDNREIVAISPDFGSFIEAFVTTPGGRPKDVIGTMF